MALFALLESQPTSSNWDFSSLSGLLREADLRVLEWTRALDEQFVSEASMADAHRFQLTGSLGKSNLSLNDLLTGLHDKRVIQMIVNTMPEPALVVNIDSDLRESSFQRIRFEHQGAVLLDVPHPRLLWDCWCPKKTNRHERCPIHSSPNAAEVENRFFNNLVEIRWRGFRFFWRNGKESWPPSVDAFLMIDSLEKKRVFAGDAKTLLDIGSGTGFLGIVAAHLSNSIVEVALWDWLLTPALYGRINWFINEMSESLGRPRDYVNVRSFVGIFRESFDGDSAFAEPFDLVVCNPPYLPVPDEFKSFSFESTTTGTQLLQHAITNSARLGRQTYLQYSHMAENEVRQAKKRAGVDVKCFSKHYVPCRIHDVGKHPDYLNFLINKRDLHREQGRLWHTLKTCSVVQKATKRTR